MKKPRLLESDLNYLEDCVKGDYVYLSNGKENFWAEVCEEEKKDIYYGIVQSKLLHKANYCLWDVILFHKNHIFSCIRFTESEDQIDANTHESHLA